MNNWHRWGCLNFLSLYKIKKVLNLITYSSVFSHNKNNYWPKLNTEKDFLTAICIALYTRSLFFLPFIFLYYYEIQFCISVIWISVLLFFCKLYFCISVICISVFLTRTLCIDKNSWYRHGLMELTRTQEIDMNSRYILRILVLTRTHGIDMDS